MPQMCLSVSADAALNRASVGESSDAAPIGFIVFSRQFLVLAFSNLPAAATLSGVTHIRLGQPCGLAGDVDEAVIVDTASIACRDEAIGIAACV